MDIKFNCPNPACQCRVSVDETMAGGSMPCPKCGATLHVPRSHDIRFNCWHQDCRQHIVVDVSEAGRSVRCPSCGKPLKIPGNPPKSLISVSIGRSHEAAMAKPSKETLATRADRPVLRLFYAWGVGALIVSGFYLVSFVRTGAAIPAGMDELAETIYYREFRDAPIANTVGSVVYYTVVAKDGADIIRLDTISMKRRKVGRLDASIGQKDFRWAGWSPDEREVAYFARLGTRSQKIIVMNAFNDAKREYEINSLGVVENCAWVTTNTLALSTYSDEHVLLNFEDAPDLGRHGRKGVVPLETLSKAHLHWLAVTSPNSIAYTASGGITNVNLVTGEATPIISPGGGTLFGLCYDAESQMYLFGMKGKGRYECYAYQYGPIGGWNCQLTRVTGAYTENAQWIQHGSGIAFMGTNYLAVQASDLRTNLFAGGTVEGYRVSRTGEEIYAIAAKKHGLKSLWRYSIGSDTLKNLVEPQGLGFIEPVEVTGTNASGESFEFYYVAPAGMDSAKKYPVILDANLSSRYDQSVQFLANAGIFYVSAGRFGITDWREAPQYEQTLDVYRALLKLPNVDPERIYISGMSLSTWVASQVVSDHPDNWRGIIFLAPTSLPRLPDKPGKFPDIYVSIGDLDTTGYREKSEQIVLEAGRKGIRAHLDYRHAPHAYPPEALMEAYKGAVRFIMEDKYYPLKQMAGDHKQM